MENIVDNVPVHGGPSLQQLWNQVLSDLEKELPSQTFSTWISPLVIVAQEGEKLSLGVPNRFFSDWLKNQNLVEQISLALAHRSGQHFQLDFPVVKPGHKKNAPYLPLDEQPQNDASALWRERSLRIGLNPRYTFDTFVVGPCNEFANAASVAVAGDSPRTYNPLFIYGGVGLGKTHLLNSIGNQKIMANPNLKVCYIHSESFMNELIQSLANKKMPEFRNKYRSMDILLVDDIQFLAGRERTQEEFFHTFNSLYESHKNIVVTSDKFPKDIPDLEDRLRSRFEWGLIADMQPPDMETKVAILQKKAEIESLVLPNDVSMFLASRICTNIRELEGSLTRIAAFASLTRTEITLELARKVLSDAGNNPAAELTVDDIVKTAASHFRLKVAEIKGKRRTKAIAWARQVSMYLARELTDSSFPEIGKRIGGKDHSTVMYAHAKVLDELANNPDVRQQVEALKKALGR